MITKISNSLLLLFLILVSCVDPFEFVIEENDFNIVVEGYISNIAYDSTLSFPSDGRYFSVFLRKTSNVDNVKDEVIPDAQVSLVDQNGNEWEYDETTPGYYLLRDTHFRALADVQYKLTIRLEDGNEFESSWEKMPVGIPAMGEISFTETSKLVYDFKIDERVIVEQKGIDVNVRLPQNDIGQKINYKWNFTPTWIFEAPLAQDFSDVKVCWATNKSYLSQNELHQDLVGGYSKKLFYTDTELNERVYYKLSVLIVQQALSDRYYEFWREVKDQSERGGLFEAPPYNIITNIKPTNNNLSVDGFFSVVHEQAKRWYFDTSDLSYQVVNRSRETCESPRPPVPQRCFNCLSYNGGVATNVKPDWWPEN